MTLLVPFPALAPEERQLIERRVGQRHPKNAAGDFYGDADRCCCFGACEPVEIAPDLIGYQEEPEGCYFKRQPTTPAEVDQAIDALRYAFVENLRYGGSDPAIVQRLRAMTRNARICMSDLCDHPSAEGEQTS